MVTDEGRMEVDSPAQVNTKMPSVSSDSRASCDSSHCQVCHGKLLNSGVAPPHPSHSFSSAFRPARGARPGLQSASGSEDSGPQPDGQQKKQQAPFVLRTKVGGPLRRDRVSSSALDAIVELPAAAGPVGGESRAGDGCYSSASVSSDDEAGDEGPGRFSRKLYPAPSRRPVSADRQPNSLQLQELATFLAPDQGKPLRRSVDMVCGLDFNQDGIHIAAAGMAKQVRVYSMQGVTYGPEGVQPEPVLVHRMPSKMSSIVWDPFCEGVVTVGDYDGVVSKVHLTSGHLLADVDEHSGRKVWSVAHSTLRPNLAVSTSDDGMARLWAGRALDHCAAVLSPPRGMPICGADFSSFNDNLLALASSDHSAYVYDLRAMAKPYLVLRGHQRPVSFARFLSRSQLLTSAIDSSLAAWDLVSSAITATPPQQPARSQLAKRRSTDMEFAHGYARRLSGDSMQGKRKSSDMDEGFDSPRASLGGRRAKRWSSDMDGDRADGPRRRSSSGVRPKRASDDMEEEGAPLEACIVPEPTRRYRGHLNSKNFVGLAVSGDEGFIACGSEDSRVYVYQPSAPTPVAWRDIVAGTEPAPHGRQRGPSSFVSAVAWRPSQSAAELLGIPVLAAATTDGSLQVLGMRE